MDKVPSSRKQGLVQSGPVRPQGLPVKNDHAPQQKLISDRADNLCFLF